VGERSNTVPTEEPDLLLVTTEAETTTTFHSPEGSGQCVPRSVDIKVKDKPAVAPGHDA
jgi:hypothetical protein